MLFWVKPDNQIEFSVFIACFYEQSGPQEKH